MQAQDIMVRGAISIGPDMPVRASAHAMVSNAGFSSVVDHFRVPSHFAED